MAAISPVEFLFSPSNTNGIQKTGTLSAPRSNIHFSSGTGAVKTDFYSMEYNLYTAGSTFAVVHLTNRKLLSLILIKKHSYTQKEGKREREKEREEKNGNACSSPQSINFAIPHSASTVFVRWTKKSR